jgi:hypothetical protein
VNDQDRVAFKRDSSGRLVMVIDYPFMVFQKAPWSMNSRLNLPILIGALAVFVLTVLFWPVSALLRRHYGRRLELDARDRRVRLLVRVVCLVNIAFVVALVVLFSVALKSIGMLTEALDPWLWLIQIVGWVGVLGTLIVLYNLSRSWANPGRWLWSKLGDALIALACLGFVWFVFAWNMVVFSLKY